MQLSAAESLSRLAIARTAELDDVTLTVYLDALEDIDPPMLRRACLDLAKQPRKDFEAALPSVGMIRERCSELVRLDQVADAATRLLPMPQSDETGPRYACLDCHDTSWRMFGCSGSGPVRGIPPNAPDISAYPCGRIKAHSPHTYAERCACWETNPVIARDRQWMRERLGKKDIRDEVKARPARRGPSQFSRVTQ